MYAVEIVKELVGDRLIVVRLEELIASPRDEIERLCDFLGVVRVKGHIDACAAHVFNQPNRRRESVKWTSRQIEMVEHVVETHPDLAGYSFSS